MTWLADLRSCGARRHGTARRAGAGAGAGFPPARGPVPRGIAARPGSPGRRRHPRGPPPGRRWTPPDLPDPAPPDDAPQATGEAARLLDLLLNQPPVGQELRTQLVTDWLQFAAASGRRVPHRLLPAAAGPGRRKAGGGGAPASRHRNPGPLASGPRAHGVRARSQLPGPRDPDRLGRAKGRPTLTHSELERLRRSDPAAARDRLRTHWDSLSARERAAHLATFATNLGPGRRRPAGTCAGRQGQERAGRRRRPA